MKKLVHILALLFFAFGLSSCNDEEKGQDSETLKISTNQIKFEANANSRTVNVSSNALWYVEVPENDWWCEVSPIEGSKNGQFQVEVLDNTSTSSRSTTITIYAYALSSDDYNILESIDLNVFQKGKNSTGGDDELSAPTGVNATQSGTSINITWNSVSGASSYKVYRSSSSSGTYSLLESTSSTSYTDNSPLSGYNYYKVSAVNSTGESTQSSYASCEYTSSGGNETQKPSTPSGVTATAQSSSSIKVSWNTVSEATSYEVYYEIGSSSTKNLAGTAYSTSYTHTGLQGNTTYYYYIKAVNSVGQSSYSSYAKATTTSETSKPNAPTGVTASRNPRSDQYVTISWNAVNGATSYKIYYATSASGTYNAIKTATGTSATQFYYNDETSYWKVSAINSAGESALSSTYGTALGWKQ